MTCRFKNFQDIAAICYLGTADSLFACMCWEDRCHVQHSASKLSILFALAWTFTQSWLIVLFAQEKLKMGFRNSFVGRFSLPFPSCVHMHTIHCTWGGWGDEKNKAFNWFSGQQINTAAWSFDNYQLSTCFIPRTGRTKGVCYFPCFDITQLVELLLLAWNQLIYLSPPQTATFGSLLLWTWLAI